MNPHTPSAREAFVREHGITEVECLFADVTGYPRGKRMPATRFAQGAELRIAQAIPMQCVTGEYSDDPAFPDADPDIRLVCDESTLRLAPWGGGRRALAIHDCEELDGSPCVFAPRSLLRAVLARYAALGLRPVVAPEIEFYLFAPHADPHQPLQVAKGRCGAPERGQMAFTLDALNEQQAFWDAFQGALKTLGIGADTWIHEVGTGQFEINLWHGDALALADQAFLFKMAAKEVALQHGLQAVYMAKPVAGEPGSSMHLHVSLEDGQGRNVFEGPEGAEVPALRHFIGGLQAHLGPWLALLAPHVNSYRRFVAGSQAPIHLGWGYDNRTSALRIPRSEARARRVENRLAGADANPYLALACTLAAGLDGIERRLEPSAAMGALDNGYDAGHGLPQDLPTALAQLRGDAHAQRLLGAAFVQGYCAVKALEYANYAREISAWERRMLLPMV